MDKFLWVLIIGGAVMYCIGAIGVDVILSVLSALIPAVDCVILPAGL